MRLKHLSFKRINHPEFLFPYEIHFEVFKRMYGNLIIFLRKKEIKYFITAKIYLFFQIISLSIKR